jgi:hypothetical protein
LRAIQRLCHRIYPVGWDADAFKLREQNIAPSCARRIRDSATDLLPPRDTLAIGRERGIFSQTKQRQHPLNLRIVSGS